MFYSIHINSICWGVLWRCLGECISLEDGVDRGISLYYVDFWVEKLYGNISIMFSKITQNQHSLRQLKNPMGYI
jgi:hypothetical protein